MKEHHLNVESLRAMTLTEIECILKEKENRFTQSDGFLLNDSCTINNITLPIKISIVIIQKCKTNYNDSAVKSHNESNIQL